MAGERGAGAAVVVVVVVEGRQGAEHGGPEEQAAVLGGGIAGRAEGARQLPRQAADRPRVRQRQRDAVAEDERGEPADLGAGAPPRQAQEPVVHRLAVRGQHPPRQRREVGAAAAAAVVGAELLEDAAAVPEVEDDLPEVVVDGVEGVRVPRGRPARGHLRLEDVAVGVAEFEGGRDDPLAGVEEVDVLQVLRKAGSLDRRQAAALPHDLSGDVDVLALALDGPYIVDASRLWHGGPEQPVTETVDRGRFERPARQDQDAEQDGLGD